MVWRLGEILKSTNVIDAHNPIHGILTEYVGWGPDDGAPAHRG